MKLEMLIGNKSNNKKAASETICSNVSRTVEQDQDQDESERQPRAAGRSLESVPLLPRKTSDE